MKTEILRTGTAADCDFAVAAAVAKLREGAAIALPTETVYGLAADALNVDAALKIFEAKERPSFDPLIVHLPDADWINRIAHVEAAEEALIGRLTARFWPGPLTLVVPRLAIVPDVVTAGLETVAVRVSTHPVFSRIVRSFGSPLAAPSANRFGRISPTNAAHVLAELNGRIPLIVDGGSTEHGLESTIIAVRSGVIEILRPGPISIEELRDFAEVTRASDGKITAPGQLPSHYAPRTPLVIAEEIDRFQFVAGKRVGLLAWRSADRAQFAEVRSLSNSEDLREAAANLFRYLRELDDAALDLIVAEAMPETGIGSAIMDRLRRASAR